MPDKNVSKISPSSPKNVTSSMKQLFKIPYEPYYTSWMRNQKADLVKTTYYESHYSYAVQVYMKPGLYVLIQRQASAQPAMHFQWAQWQRPATWKPQIVQNPLDEFPSNFGYIFILSNWILLLFKMYSSWRFNPDSRVVYSPIFSIIQRSHCWRSYMAHQARKHSRAKHIGHFQLE